MESPQYEYTSQELFLFYHYNYEAVVVVLSNPQQILQFLKRYYLAKMGSGTD